MKIPFKVISLLTALVLLLPIIPASAVYNNYDINLFCDGVSYSDAKVMLKDEGWDGSIASEAELFAEGSGNEVSPYIIRTPSQMARLSIMVNNGNGFPGVYFRLACDLRFNDTTNWQYWGGKFTQSSNGTTQIWDGEYYPSNYWIPIGIVTNPFYGHFDGNNHTVSGLCVNLPQTDYVGFFGNIFGGSVKNLTVDSSFFCGADIVSAVTGMCYNGSVENCKSNANVNGDDYLGGIIGRSRHSDVSECHFYGNVLGNVGMDVHQCAGGIIGYSQDYGGETIIYNCTNTGTIQSNQYVGGIIGYKDDAGKTDNCRNSGLIEADNSVSYAGGIGGCLIGDIVNCSNSGEVRAKGQQSGGIAGTVNKKRSITDCSNTGEVYGTSYCGGISGYCFGGAITDCINTGAVIGTNKWLGGIVGGHSSSDAFSVSNVKNSGDVNSSVGYAGGIAGVFTNGTITKACNTGDVTGDKFLGGIVGSAGGIVISDSYNTGSLTGSENVGGIVGYSSSTMSVHTSYSSGTVSSGISNAAMFGSICGEETIDSCFYLQTASLYGWYNHTDNSYFNIGALSENEMNNRDNFQGFDFANQWQMLNAPILSNQDFAIPAACISEDITKKTPSVDLLYNGSCYTVQTDYSSCRVYVNDMDSGERVFSGANSVWLNYFTLALLCEPSIESCNGAGICQEGKSFLISADTVSGNVFLNWNAYDWNPVLSARSEYTQQSNNLTYPEHKNENIVTIKNTVAYSAYGTYNIPQTVGININFENNLELCIAISKPDKDESVFGLIFFTGSDDFDINTEGIEIPDLNWQNNLARATYRKFSSKMIQDTLRYRIFRIRNGIYEYFPINECSIADYIYNQLVNAEPVYADLLEKTLAYGLCSQDYFDYRTELLPTQMPVPADHSNDTDISSVSTTARQPSSEIKFASANIRIGDEVSLIVSLNMGTVSDLGTRLAYRKSGTEEFSVINNECYDNNGRSAYEFVGIAAKDYCNMFDIVILNPKGDIISDTLHYSVATYAKSRVNSSTNQSYVRLMNSLIDYGYAAELYFSQKER